MNVRIVNGYHVAGNDYVAIAINVGDPTDAHYFTDGRPDGGLAAYDWAVAWTSPGDDD